MYRVLCFGDSNTWGYNPANGLRFSETERWPGVLAEDLGSGFEIFEEGRNGRRVLEGSDDLVSALRRYEPLDVIVLYLGINDICFERNSKVSEIIEGINLLLKEIGSFFADLRDAAPEIILIGSALINKAQIEDCLYEIEAEKVVRFNSELRELAGSNGCGFIDAGRIIETSQLDGIHLESEEHRKLGHFISDYSRTFLTNTNMNSNRG